MLKHSGRVKLLCLVVCVFLCGCNANSEKNNTDNAAKTVTVMIVSSSSPAAGARISQALSQVTLERYGFNVELILSPHAEYNTALSRLRALGKTPDIFIAFNPATIISLKEKGLILSLNGVLEDSSLMREADQEKIRSSVTIDGQIYAVPGNDPQSYAQGFLARRDILDKLGVDAGTITTWDELHELLLLVKQTFPDVVPVVPHTGSLISTFEDDPLGDGIGVLIGNTSTVVENYYESEEFYRLCAEMHKWYAERLILEDSFSYVNEPRNVLMTAFNGFGYFAKINVHAARNGFVLEGFELENIQLSLPYVNTSVIGIYWCVSSLSDKADEAMKLIELLYTDRDAADICLYGQENTDYLRIDENHVTSIGNRSSWNSSLWGWPNRLIASTWVNPDTYETMLYELKGQPIISPAYGFAYNPSSVQNQVDACRNIINKYANALISGYLDPDTAIPLFNKELLAAGINEVIAEKQAQLDRFLAGKEY